MSELATYEDEIEGTGLATLDDTLADIGGGLDEGGGGAKLPRVSFYSSYAKGDRPKLLADRGVKLGQFYLQDVDGITARDPFTIFVPNANFVYTFYAKFDNKGKTVGHREKRKGGWQPDFANPADKGWKESSIALVLVPLSDDVITAAFLDTNSAVQRLWKPIADAMQRATDARAWGAKSPKHEAAAKALLPGGRFLASISVYEEPGKRDPSSKNVIGRSLISPTPEPLVAAFNDYATSGALTTAAGIYRKRVQKLLDMKEAQ